MKKKQGFFIGFAVLMIAAMFTMAGCDNGIGEGNNDGTGGGSNGGTGGGSGGGGIDNALVAKWHSTQAAADSGTSTVFEITADGNMTGEAFTTPVQVTTSAGRISAVTTVNGQTVDGGSANYVVEGTTLRFSNPSTAGGYFTSLIAGQDFSIALGGDGKYHKKAGSGTGGTGGGSSSIDCSSLSAGTECTAQSKCGSQFLCLTGQGSDSNCTTDCSCQ